PIAPSSKRMRSLARRRISSEVVSDMGRFLFFGGGGGEHHLEEGLAPFAADDVAVVDRESGVFQHARELGHAEARHRVLVAVGDFLVVMPMQAQERELAARAEHARDLAYGPLGR